MKNLKKASSKSRLRRLGKTQKIGLLDITKTDATFWADAKLRLPQNKTAIRKIMHSPPHPGKVILLECIEALGITVTHAAKGLGVSRKTLSELINCRAGVSPEMAIRLEKAGWSTADTWLKLQMQHDLWQARQKAGSLKVKKIHTHHKSLFSSKQDKKIFFKALLNPPNPNRKLLTAAKQYKKISSHK